MTCPHHRNPFARGARLLREPVPGRAGLLGDLLGTLTGVLGPALCHPRMPTGSRGEEPRPALSIPDGVLTFLGEQRRALVELGQGDHDEDGCGCAEADQHADHDDGHGSYGARHRAREPKRPGCAVHNARCRLLRSEKRQAGRGSRSRWLTTVVTPSPRMVTP